MPIPAKEAVDRIRTLTLSTVEEAAKKEAEEILDNRIENDFNGVELIIGGEFFSDLFKSNRFKEISGQRKEIVKRAIQKAYEDVGWKWDFTSDQRDGSYWTLKAMSTAQRPGGTFGVRD
jgi:hypothetical protein